jgi:RNA polymerase sigma-70 factor (ECF subfamily)
MDMPSKFDRYLLIKIQDQDEDVFEELSFKYRDRLYRSAVAMTRSESDADDLVQETFVRAYRCAPRFEGKSAIYTWLYGIMRNVQLDRWRKVKRDPMLTDFSDFDVEDESGFEGGTKIEVVHQEVSTLADSSREVIRLFYFDELSVEEIAEKLNCAEGTIKSRLFHARKKLKDKKNLQDLMGRASNSD